MKKLLSLLLAVLVLTNGFVCLAYSDVNQEDYYCDSAERLADFGFMSGYEDDTFRPDGYLTRAEASKLICTISVANIDDYDTTNVFSDTAQHWAKKYISILAAKEVIKGYEDNTFRPDDTISNGEILKMLVAVLGYGHYAELTGGYPEGYLNIASELSLWNQTPSEAPVKRGDAAVMIDTAVNTPLCMTSGFDMDAYGVYIPVFEIKDMAGENYQTLLTAIHNIYTVSATVGKDDSIKADSSNLTQLTDIEKRDIFNFLDITGIMKEDEKIDLSKTATREDLAKFGFRLFGSNAAGSNIGNEYAIEDVKTTDENYYQVSMLMKYGYITGSEKNKKLYFMPEDKLSYEDAMTFGAVALNIKNVENYVTAAENEKLGDGIDKTAQLSLEDLGVILYKIARSPRRINTAYFYDTKKYDYISSDQYNLGKPLRHADFSFLGVDSFDGFSDKSGMAFEFKNNSSASFNIDKDKSTIVLDLSDNDKNLDYYITLKQNGKTIEIGPLNAGAFKIENLPAEKYDISVSSMPIKSGSINIKIY